MIEIAPVKFLYVGQIRPEKGVDNILEAAQYLLAEGRRLNVTIAGELKGWSQGTYGDQLIAKVQSSPKLKANVSFLGNVEDIDALFQCHEVHIAPSIFQEPYGLVVVEAKQNKKASIVYPSGGMVELVEHGQDGLICEESTSISLVGAMRAFLDDKRLSSSMGEMAFRSLERLGLSREAYRRRWGLVVESLVADGRKPKSSSNAPEGRPA